MSQSVYMVRHVPTGMFSLGGRSPRPAEVGKMWTDIERVKAHINRADYEKPEEWEVVAFELQVMAAAPISLSMLKNEVARLKLVKDLAGEVVPPVVVAEAVSSDRGDSLSRQVDEKVQMMKDRIDA